MKLEDIKELVLFAKAEGLTFLKVGEFEVHLMPSPKQQLDLSQLIGKPKETEEDMQKLMRYSV